MMRFNLPRAATLLVLCALLASPLAAAPKFRSESSPTAAEDLFGWLRGALSLMWSKNGCQLDPHGRCLDKAATPPVSTKNGCQIDPYGRCIG